MSCPVFLFAFTAVKIAQWERWSIPSGKQTSLNLPLSSTDVFMMSVVPSWPALVCSELSWCFLNLKIVICAQSGTFLGRRNFFLPFKPVLVFWAAVNTSLANVVFPCVQVISIPYVISQALKRHGQRAAWLAQFIQRLTRDLGVVSLSPMLGVEIT